MKTFFLTISLYCFLLLLMIIVNEQIRINIPKHNYQYNTIKTIHPEDKSFTKCSWICHNRTIFCQQNHVKFLKNKKYVQSIYFGVISFLKGSGDYSLANVLILVIMFPLVSVWFFAKGILLRLSFKTNK